MDFQCGQSVDNMDSDKIKLLLIEKLADHSGVISMSNSILANNYDEKIETDLAEMDFFNFNL